MDLQLAGKRAVVTGAARGIGLAVATTLAAEGARVALVGRDLATLTAAADEVGGGAKPSGGPAAGLAELTDDEMREHFETKVLGYLHCCRAVAPHMTAQGWGRIVNISGLNARLATSTMGSIRRDPLPKPTSQRA